MCRLPPPPLLFFDLSLMIANAFFKQKQGFGVQLTPPKPAFKPVMGTKWAQLYLKIPESITSVIPR